MRFLDKHTTATVLPLFLSVRSSTKRPLLFPTTKTTHPSSLSLSLSSSSSSSLEHNNMPRILCLHGKSQTGSTFSNKIGGARRKLSRNYELHFLDGPIVLLPEHHDQNNGGKNDNNNNDDAPQQSLAWWLRDEDGEHVLIQEALDYIARETKGVHYDAILGFSQGGTLATVLAVSGIVPGVRAVVTSGAPIVEDAFDVAMKIAAVSNPNRDGIRMQQHRGLRVPKLHFAGERDVLVSVQSTRDLCERGGNGEVVVHEKGHLFPTNAARVNAMLEFLESALERKE